MDGILDSLGLAEQGAGDMDRDQNGDCESMSYQPNNKRSDLEPGDWIFTNLGEGAYTYFWFGCPCGDGELAGIPISTDKAAKGKHWHWNGDLEKPTLTPSIQRRGSCTWHGYLTDGEFKSC